MNPEGKIIKSAIIVDGHIYVGFRHSDIRNIIVTSTNISKEKLNERTI